MNSDTASTAPCLVITGASRGIGLATAQHFLAQGYRVINISRSPAPLDGITQLTADLCTPGWEHSVQQLLLQSVAAAERVVIVHNAALQPHGGVRQLQAESLRRVLELNVVAPALLNSLLFEAMPAGSAILYIGSTLSLKATADVAAYVTSKHALLGLMRSTCQDLAGSDIHTACICPGFTDTEMLRGFGGDMVQRLAARSTYNRLVEPAEIADAVYFCATNAVVNGTVLRADLGLIEQ